MSAPLGSRGAAPPAARIVWTVTAAVICAGTMLSVFVHPLAGIVAVGAAVATPFVLARVEVALVLLVGVITLVPFAALPLNVGFSPTALDFALGALYAIWLVRLATRADPLLPLPPFALAFVALAGWMGVAFLSGLSHGTPTKNQMRSFGELVLGAGLFFVVWTVAQRPAVRRSLVRALLVGGTIGAAIGLALYLLPDAMQMRLLSLLGAVDYPTGPGVLRYLNDDPARLQRATGTAVDPNSFGGMLAVIAALLAAQVGSRHGLLPRRAAGLMLSVVVLAVLATVSRGSLLACAAGVSVVAAWVDRRILLWAAVASALGVAVAPLLPWTAGYVEHLLAGFAGQDLATQMRFGEYGDALQLIGRYPWLGVGFGSVRDIDLYRGVSSLYLIVAESVGLVGLALFVGAFGLVFGWTALAVRRLPPGEAQPIALGAVAALAAAAVGGVFDHYFFTYPHAFALLVVVAAVGVSAGSAAPGD